jgi:Spy/CpxP family protein refolding chaperone
VSCRNDIPEVAWFGVSDRFKRRMAMRGCRKWTLTLVALCACSMPARAADDKAKPVPEEGALELVLLRHKAVRDDLKLTHREARKIHEFTEQQWKKAQKIEELADEKEKDRRYNELTREDERFLDEVLTPEQKKRLDQITLQVAGLMWITRPDVAAALKLTDEQKKKAAEYQKVARKEMEELLHSETRRDRQAELRKLHATCKERVLELLTDEQEAKFHEMIGHPFRGELSFDEPPLVEEIEKK